MAVTLGTAIRSLRHSAGLSQRELASVVGVGYTYLSHIEADRREPTLRVLRQIAAALKVPPSFLFSIIFLVDLPDQDRLIYGEIIEQLLQIAHIGSDQSEEGQPYG